MSETLPTDGTDTPIPTEGGVDPGGVDAPPPPPGTQPPTTKTVHTKTSPQPPVDSR